MEVFEIEKVSNKKTVQAKCPVCGYHMPFFYMDEAVCKGVMVSCKGRNCHAVFELKIKDGKQMMQTR